MSPRKSHSKHNDPHLNRLPYEQGPRQGRFGRVENWREAEKRQAEQVKRHRQEHSRKARQGNASQQGAQPGDAGNSGKIKGHQAAQAQPENAGVQGASQRSRRKPVEPNPWQQGRFGRVENWREEEERRERYQQAVAQAQAARLAKAQAKAAAKKQAQASGVAKQPSAAQQRAQARQQRAVASQQQAQAQAQSARQPQNAQQPRASRVKQGAQATAVASPRSASQQTVPAQQPQRADAHAAAQEAAKRQQILREHTARKQQEAAVQHRADQAQRQNAAASHKAVADQERVPRAKQQTASAQAQQEGAQQQAQRTSRQHAQVVQNHEPAFDEEAAVQGAHSRQVEEPMRAISADEKLKYSRASYVKNLQQKPIGAFVSGQHSKGQYDRRPEVDYPEDKSKSLTGKIPKIPLKLVAAIAAVIVVFVVAGFLTFAQNNEDANLNKAAAGGGSQQNVSLPTPIMSESSGIEMHSAVAMEDLTEILIHNASYAYANEITTRLAEAHNDDILAAHGTGRVASEQPTGDNWMTGEFIRCFRSGNAGPVMSAIDCGGPVGATVYAPVTGEVVMVKEYKLYDQIDDFRVHIQPTGRPDLDVVLIHLTDVIVKPGDKVTAGVTPIAKIRDIFQFLEESLQLKNYTAESDNGNHTHIQVNNANHPEYTALNELKPEVTEAPNVAATP